jgi:hypothetical protein
VWSAYGWRDANPATVSDEVILERLLALNMERATAGRSQSTALSTDRVISIEPSQQTTNGRELTVEAPEADPDLHVIVTMPPPSSEASTSS